MSHVSTREENRDIAAVVSSGVLVAASLALGAAIWSVRVRMEQTFKESGIQLPGITIFALDHPLINLLALTVLAGCAVMIAMRGLRVIGLCSWMVTLSLYLGFWALAVGLPYVKITKQLGEQTSSL